MTLDSLTREQCNKLYEKVLRDNDVKTMRELCLTDLFFLLTVSCRRKDMNRDWIFDRCREVYASPDGYIDLWAREHFKSSIITFGLTIQDLLNDPEDTIGILSCTRPIAKAFLGQIKREFENNTFLKGLFPEALWENPEKESPKWNMDDGIILKRKGNPKESSIEAWGLVDGQPTSKHFKKLIYEDVVVRESVTTPDMINKVNKAFEESTALESNTPGVICKKRIIGTRWHHNDTYKMILDRGIAIPRIYPATENGKMDGKPVLFDTELLALKRRTMGPYTFSALMLQNPTADRSMGFDIEWLRPYNVLNNNKKWNYFLLVDGASEKKRNSDYTVMVVIGLAPDNNYYLVDGIRDRLNLTERTNWLFKLHRNWRPLRTGYERYGKDSDIEHIKYIQEQEGYRFNIEELGGAMPKNDRIRRIVPIFEQGRFYTPHSILYPTTEGKMEDFMRHFMDEFQGFPVAPHDDVLDAVSRIVDDAMKAVFPTITESLPLAVPQINEKDYDPLERAVVNSTVIPNASDWKTMMTRT